jgi:DNA-binding XRE family transcriptional regulator
MEHGISPVAVIRQEMGLSKSEMARLVRVQAPTYEYIEQGAYGNLPKSLIKALRPINANIATEYEEWKIRKRLNWNGPVQIKPEFPQLTDIMHPHTEWRTIYCVMSPTHYAEALCIPRIVVQKLEGDNPGKKFPQELQVALIMACGSSVCQRIKTASKEYINGA